MKFWCFYFEGWFADDALEDPGHGVFSECLVQEDEYVDAEFAFLEALADRGINLIEISESFPVDTAPEEMDREDEENTFWLEWCAETSEAGRPTFEAFHLYPPAEVPRVQRDN